MTSPRIQELADRAWALFDDAVTSANEIVVQPSMPILYFGDSEAYRRSLLKIVTVGLNPSLKEFPTSNSWLRFPGGGRRESYLGSLDAYFRTQPYRDWFSSYEPLLNGMSASYYPGFDSVALHTDICSPVATSPTWSKLGDRRALVGDGFELWRDLVETLAPEVVLVSVAKRYLLRLTPKDAETWPTAHVLERANPYYVRMFELNVGRHRAPVVFGRAAQKPFGTIGHRDKITVGNALRRILDAG